MKTSKALLILTLLLIIISCKSGHISKKELQVQYDNLTKENQKLNDSISELISQFEYDSIKPIINLTDTPKIVYRGMRNKLNISIIGATSINVISKTGGVSKEDSIGNFKIVPSKGRSIPIVIKAKMLNGEYKEFNDTLKIKDFGRTKTSLNGYTGKIKLTKEKLKNALIRGHVDNYIYNHKFVLRSFKIKIPKVPTVTINGDVITEEVYNQISSHISTGDEIYIFGLNNVLKGFRGCIKNPRPLQIEIVDE